MGGWRSWVLLIAVTMAGLGTMEAMVRTVRPQVLVRAYGMADADLGTVLRANARYHDTFGNDYHIATNGQALRQPDERDFARQGVAFYGDSFTFGFGVAYEESYFALIKRAIEADNGNRQLLNAAVPGYSSGHVKKLIERQIGVLRPAALVYFFNSNDLIDNIIEDVDYRVTAFGIDSQGRVELVDQPPFASWKRFLLTRTPYGWLNQHSHLFVLAKDVLKKAINKDRQLTIPEIEEVDAPARPSSQATTGVDSRLNPPRHSTETAVAMPAPQPAYVVASSLNLPRHSIETVVAVSLAHVERIADIARDAQLPLLLVWVPHPDEMEARPAPPPVLALLSKGRLALADLARRRGDFDFVDTTGLLPVDEEWRERSPALRFAGDGHFNPAGNAWFAALVEPAIRGFLDRRLTNQK